MTVVDAIARPAVPLFDAPYAEDDGHIARRLLAEAHLPHEREAKVDVLATHLVHAIRSRGGRIGGVEDLLREYALSTREGLALMVLAEALLRVPDAATADRLIEDKLSLGDFVGRKSKSSTLLAGASAWALDLTTRILHPGETPEGIIAQLTKRLGAPAVRAATRQAMRVLGGQFVLGQDIGEALRRAASGSARLYRYSFDMLGEGARTAADAERYFRSYAGAIEAIGKAAGNDSLPNRPGISVKLSALHPRYEAVGERRVLRELVPKLLDLARLARDRDLNFTIDAEEADRLELSLDVVAAALRDGALAGWDGFGLAVQAYQKRALAVIDHVADLSGAINQRMMVRLVKGAYWDTEVKRAQERGLDDYPVFTRKPMTDLSYLACAERMLELRACLYPQFATHNALTVASIIERAGGVDSYEFQRLHGMGEDLYARLLELHPGAACRTYAPVGRHKELLAYLVRRLLENGANSSFVSVAVDPAVPVAHILTRPHHAIAGHDRARHGELTRPADMFEPHRRNSAGVEFGDRKALASLQREMARGAAPGFAAPVVDGAVRGGPERKPASPIDGRTIAGRAIDADAAVAAEAMLAARRGFRAWDETAPDARAAILERASKLLEAHRGRFLHLLQVEGGKTLDDALSEVREAIDFLRYYAVEARRLFGAPTRLPGPTGEENVLRLRGRGVFVAISPWNFPLAIFVGQVAAALAAGNAVVAKPAEQTPLVAAEAVRLLHEAGIPAGALQFVPGDGAVGAALVAHRDVAGVVFTGSTAVARAINRALAAKDGPIVPLVAETGGLNAMIVDATALPEQVADDVVMSAFRSAGQRCSALRLLCVQEDVADGVIAMIAGAAAELAVGDPRDLAVQVGPVIDADAKGMLDGHIARLEREATRHYAGKAPTGLYVAPHIFELKRPGDLREEVFGPILHVVRYEAAGLDRLLDGIAESGYGLTLGLHTRIDGLIEQVTERLAVGNVYVNRNMIGAVVGVQPFGGHGLSGTGPKAGGPHYLLRFATEQTVTINSAAAGGNAALLASSETG